MTVRIQRLVSSAVTTRAAPLRPPSLAYATTTPLHLGNTIAMTFLPLPAPAHRHRGRSRPGRLTHSAWAQTRSDAP